MEENKKLQEVLTELGEDAIVAIGASKGANFVYIGRAGDIELMDKCFNNHLSTAKRMLTKHGSTLRTLIMQPPTLGDDDNLNLNTLLERSERISTVGKTCINNKNYIETYTPVLKRTVTKTYYKEVDDCTAIIVEGSEAGGFWFKSEFDKKHKTK